MRGEEYFDLPLLLWRGIYGYAPVLLPKRKPADKKQMKRLDVVGTSTPWHKRVFSGIAEGNPK